MHKEKGRNSGGFHNVHRDIDIRDNPVLKESYGPAEKKQIKVMIPLSKIFNWFKKRRK